MFLSTTGRKLGIGLVVFGAIQLVMLSIAFAQPKDGPAVFDVRRSLPLEPEEPVYHDFYIDAGNEAGFKKGMYVTVVRKIPVHDPVGNKQQATLNITVGKLQVIHVEKNITVARLHSELGDEERPTLEFEAIMIGDQVDMGSLTMDKPKEPKKFRAKKTAQVAPAAGATSESAASGANVGGAETAATESNPAQASPAAIAPAALPPRALPEAAQPQAIPLQPGGVSQPTAGLNAPKVIAASDEKTFPSSLAPDMVRVSAALADQKK